MTEYVFAGEFDAVLEELEDLIFGEEIRGGDSERRRRRGGGFAAAGGCSCSACLGTFELVVVGAEEEGACWGLETRGN